MIRIERGVLFTQAYGCAFCLHIGSVAIYLGRRRSGQGPRLELFTPRRRFRWSGGTEK